MAFLFHHRWGLGPMAQRKKQLIAEGKLDKHGRPNAETPPEYLRALPDANGWASAQVVMPTCEAFEHASCHYKLGFNTSAVQTGFTAGNMHTCVLPAA